MLRTTINNSYQYSVGILIFLILWHILSLLLHKPFFPPPIPVLIKFVQLLYHGLLLKHCLISLYRVVCSIVISFLLAVSIGIIMGRCTKLDNIIFPLIYLLYPIPKVAFLPIIIVIFGLSDLPKIFLIFLIVFFQLVIAVRDAAKNIPSSMVLSMQSLQATPWQTFLHLIFPSSLPKIFTALRISMGTAIAVLFFAETFASNSGIGFFILDMMEKREFLSMYAGITSLGVLGLLFYSFIDLMEKLICPWSKL